jgi:serine phosphatase RsbU (regulator of sigma subunit)
MAQNDTQTKKVRRPVVMIVDDESLVTDSITSFFELEGGYEVLGFQSPHAALERLRERPVDLIISDFLMPEMDGLKLLTEARKLCPEAPRILLTGYADKENAIRAINEVGLFQYVEKPWDNDNLLMVVRNALKHKSLREVLSMKIRQLDRTLRQRDELARREDLLRRELSIARRLQQGMLPQQLPPRNGFLFEVCYQPAMEIGGDFYDIVPLANGRMAVLLTDATGHGIQAALSTALVKFAFSEFRGANVGAADILAGMNGVLHRGLPQEVFIAAQVAVVDTGSGRCFLANAGLPHPYRLLTKERTARRIPADGLLLGFTGDDDYQRSEELQVDLSGGDTLVLYSDGLSEQEDDTGRHFEDEQLARSLADAASLPVDGILEKLMKDARTFRRPGGDLDDVTIVGIQRGST